jgi:hypothetical protein
MLLAKHSLKPFLISLHSITLFTLFFFEIKNKNISNHLLFISYHLFFIIIQIKKLLQNKKISLFNTIFLFSHINNYFLF